MIQNQSKLSHTGWAGEHFLILAARHSSIVLIGTKTWIFMRHFLILPRRHPRSWYFTLRSNLTCKPGAPQHHPSIPVLALLSLQGLNDFVQYEEYKTSNLFSTAITGPGTKQDLSLNLRFSQSLDKPSKEQNWKYNSISTLGEIRMSNMRKFLIPS